MNRPSFRAWGELLIGLLALAWLSAGQLPIPSREGSGAPAFAQQARRSSAPAKRPIRKSGLINALRINGLSTAELVREIERRGVDFTLTYENAQELIAAGATAEILDAVHANYRGADTTATSGANATDDNPPRDPGAGGSSTAGADHRKNDAATSPPEPDYDAIFDRGLSALRAERFDEALAHFTTLASLQPSDPRPFSMMGMTYLYWKPDLAAAESNMRRAIALGGSAIFRVRHDHDGLFVDFCVGSLFISADDITFRADNGKHTFAATRDIITEVKMNSFVGSEYGAFHIKVRAEQKKVKTYNFAPSANQRYESELALRLYAAGDEMKRRTLLRD